MAKKIEYSATLIGGSTFTVSGMKFEKGIKRDIKKELFEYLGKNEGCFYTIMVDDKPESRSRFKLESAEIEAVEVKSVVKPAEVIAPTVKA